jgi:hypothetical protein
MVDISSNVGSSMTQLQLLDGWYFV